MAAILIIVSVIAATLLGFSNPFSGGQNQVGSPWVDPNAIGDPACQPNIDSNRVLKVDVDPALTELYANESKPEFDKRNDEWVLIKTAAPIPAWKLNRKNDARGGKEYSELEKMGTMVNAGTPANPDIGGDAYIGVGWCDPDTGESFGHGAIVLGRNACLDPLTQDVMFVPEHEGAIGFNDESWLNNSGWANDPNADPPKTQENIDQYWWRFNVYYKKSLLPPNPTVNDLPCWIQELANQCPGAGDINGDNRYGASLRTTCEQNNQGADVLSATNPTIDVRATLHLGTTLIINAPVPDGITIVDDYLYVSETTTPPTGAPVIGSAWDDHFNVHIRVGMVAGSGGDHSLVLESPAYPGTYYVYVPISDTSKPEGAATLQLGSFIPNIPSFFYEWWTPACKPAIYLYPEKETEVAVRVKPEGFITTSIPEHGKNGWNVIAQPNGSLTTLNNQQLDLGYLYYEAVIHKVHVPKNRGWIRTTEELPAFFSSTLSQLGLNEQERRDFLDYWIPKLKEEDKWFITLIDREELDRVEPIEFSKSPDNFIRIRFYFEKLDDKNKNEFINLSQVKLPNVADQRTGFIAVDWGGIVGNGSCGLEEKTL